jgi:2-succinyl-6-hydroxy-2,4-cyclohexadiene-1-carboxylate synthase
MSAHEPPLLHVELLEAHPGDDRRSVALVHGFTQTSRCWAPLDRHLAVWGSVWGVDLPGHGASPPGPVDLWSTGRAAASATPADLHLGYSLGGRVLLHGSLADPEAVDRLVLIGAHPGIEDPDARRRRRAEDDARAEHLERVGTAAFLDEWLAGPLFAGLDPARAHRRARLVNEAGALADALRMLGTGVQDPLWDRLGELAMPVLVLAGERDGRFREIGTRTAQAIGANATFATVPQVGHAVHLEDPKTTTAIVRSWLDASG